MVMLLRVVDAEVVDDDIDERHKWHFHLSVLIELADLEHRAITAFSEHLHQPRSFEQPTAADTALHDEDLFTAGIKRINRHVHTLAQQAARYINHMNRNARHASLLAHLPREPRQP